MANETWSAYAARVLYHVADNIRDYLPGEWLLEGSELVVRIPDTNTMPTVELDGVMPATSLGEIE